MNHFERKNKKEAKKWRQQDKKKAFEKESNERDTKENYSDTDTFSGIKNPNKTALEDSNQNIASETNNKIKEKD